MIEVIDKTKRPLEKEARFWSMLSIIKGIDASNLKTDKFICEI